ncbi:MAG: restriction endonuclease subunit S, partial [Saprospiraceae bacterium]
MKSNYKKIGDHIRLVDERNAGLKGKALLGLSISKQFIPSVANIIGTDMENYKIIRRNQFACSTMQVRRDKKMPVALLQEVDEAIISSAYPVFEVINSEELLPEYLMMWFTRKEFDREACFYAIGGVRGSLEWEDFCGMKLPIPHPDKQKEIIKEYNAIADRIALNNQLIRKLEETAQTIYKQWFVDFEFPDEDGRPYKSSSGELVESELGDIPKGWQVSPLKSFCSK